MSTNYKLQRTNAKSSLTRFTTHFELIKNQPENEINFEELQLRLKNANNLLEQFEYAQTQIETSDDNYLINEKIYFLERTDFENKYYQITSAVQKFIAEKTKLQPRSTSPFEYNNTMPTSRIKLPTLNLPTFDGAYDQWLFFRDTFNSVIHENTSLADTQKFHYLRLSLKGTAADVIKSLEISETNYAVAWQLLLERFENKLLLINNHVKGLFNITTLTKESHQGLRLILDNLEKHLRALEALKLPVQHWDILIIYLITSKLDNISKRDWEKIVRNSDKLPTKTELTNFLKDKCCILESLDSSHCQEETKRIYNKPSSQPYKSKSFVTTSTTTCAFCNKNHTIYSCPDFIKLDPTDKLNEARRLWLCVNCLSTGHKTRECKSGGCRKCGLIHHTLLHFNNTSGHRTSSTQQNRNPSSTSTISNSNSSGPDSNESIALTTNNPNLHKTSLVLLSTAVVKVYDFTGNSHNCRILLDNGSQSNFISQRLCQILQLPTKKINFSVSGINQVNSKINFQTNVLIKSTINEFSCTLSCLVLPNITGNVPTISLNKNPLKIPSNLTLADPSFDKAAPVDMLVGADTFWELLSVGQIKLGRGYPILQKTKLGWLVSGPIYLNSPHDNATQCHLNISPNVNDQLTKFWEIEECPKTKFLSQEDDDCERHFQQNTTNSSDGRFIVSIPLKTPTSELGESKDMAMNRFLNLERKLSKTPELKIQYHDFINDYIEQNHMSLANDQEDITGFFLPHHCVFKESSSTTKLRVVFDGSAKTTTGVSINDLMMVGPTIQDDLLSIILRFRKHNIVLSGDIAKMYRQVLVPAEQRKLQKILWRFNELDKIKVYELNTVTYGLTSSAFMAIRALHEAARRHAHAFPKASSTILEDFYVDDLITGGDNLEEVKALKHQIITILNKHGFELRKFLSNDNSISDDDKTTNSVIKFGTQNKLLGILWHSKHDILKYKINEFNYKSKITKRQILSTIAQIFDPLGLLSPVTITAKIILQKLWKLNLSWDETIPQDLHTVWEDYTKHLTILNDLEIPRQVLVSNSISIQLHGFSDASESAYGACIYVRYRDDLGNHNTNLLCAKTRVAPLKHTTIPRLELCGALLLSELADKVKNAMHINFDKIFYWSDSTIVLSWIHTCPSLLKVFVANRVSQIQTFTNPNFWHHVNTAENPADLLSRGTTTYELLNSTMWFHGPTWLSTPEEDWPLQNKINSEVANQSEHRKVTTLLSIYEPPEFITKFSSLNRLTRAFAKALRFIQLLKYLRNIRKGISDNIELKKGSLQSAELEDSLHVLIRMVQKKHFTNEYKILQNSKTLHSNSKLLNLNPFMDKNGLIRVGGRIQNSDYNFDKKHPILLPQHEHLTTLIGKREHLRLLHAGPQALLASLRQQYWPLSGRSFAKKIIHNCLTCFKLTAKQQPYLMGNLPTSRLTPTRPFLIAGVDYAGPYLIRDRKTRNFKTSKAYISLFVCFVTKAMHLEIVSDLTTECFLAALRRFMARRGKCSHIHSDQGTTFVGANNELQNFLRHHEEDFTNALVSEGVIWKFIPPRSPHFGGLWEAGVKSVKFHLKRILKDTLLTYEEFATVLAQVESCVNSRPLYPLSNDPNDPNPLTPAHFLIGTSLTSLPEPSWLNTKENQLSRFQHLQQMYQHFWSRWTKEYVSNLQIRCKWKQNMPQLVKPGAMVVIMEDGLPPLKWRIGRILDVHPGKDDIIRAVTIRTAHGIFKRPVVKVCVLPEQNV